MDGWTDERSAVHRSTGGLTDRRPDRPAEGRINGQMYGWSDRAGRVKRWMDRQTRQTKKSDGQTDGKITGVPRRDDFGRQTERIGEERKLRNDFPER